jgi:hypothetical protein
MGWARYAARMREMKNKYMGLVVKPKGRDYLEDLVVDCRFILTFILH